MVAAFKADGEKTSHRCLSRIRAQARCNIATSCRRDVPSGDQPLEVVQPGEETFNLPAATGSDRLAWLVTSAAIISIPLVVISCWSSASREAANIYATPWF
jgi:hypothetical protein